MFYHAVCFGLFPINGAFDLILLVTVTCKLSLRISKSVPVRRTRNCETRIQRTTPHEPRNAIYNLLATVFYFKSLFCLKLTR